MPGTSTDPYCHDSCNPRPEQRREADRKRWVEDKAVRALYNSAHWKQLRAFIIARDPICKKCNRYPSAVVDHINDHKGNPVLFYSANNCQGLCKQCHDRKTGSTNGFGTDRPDIPQKTSIQINGVVYPLAGSSAVQPTEVAGSSPVPLISSAPPLVPVKPEHMSLPDGRVAIKQEFNRWYVKRGARWFLLPVTFDPAKEAENGLIKKT